MLLGISLVYLIFSNWCSVLILGYFRGFVLGLTCSDWSDWSERRDWRLEATWATERRKRSKRRSERSDWCDWCDRSDEETKAMRRLERPKRLKRRRDWRDWRDRGVRSDVSNGETKRLKSHSLDRPVASFAKVSLSLGSLISPSHQVLSVAVASSPCR